MKAHEGMSKKEFRQLLKLAQSGDVKAQLQTAIALYNGWGVEENGPEAFKWVSQAAKNGYAESMCQLGAMYYIGDCCERDYEKAYQCCASAVSMGYPQCAQYVNEIYVARALENGDLEEAKAQLEVRDKAWNTPFLAESRIMARVFNVFFAKLQDRLAEKELKEVIPAHTDERLQMSRSGSLTYGIKTGNPDIFYLRYEYCQHDNPPFLASAFYARKPDAENADVILEKCHGDYVYKNEGQNFGLAFLRNMTGRDFLEEKIIRELAEETGRLYATIEKVEKTLWQPD